MFIEDTRLVLTRHWQRGKLVILVSHSLLAFSLVKRLWNSLSRSITSFGRQQLAFSFALGFSQPAWTLANACDVGHHYSQCHTCFQGNYFRTHFPICLENLHASVLSVNLVYVTVLTTMHKTNSNF